MTTKILIYIAQMLWLIAAQGHAQISDAPFDVPDVSALAERSTR